MNGLTGDIKEDGQWYKEKMDQLLTRELLIEISSNLDSELISTDVENIENKDIDVKKNK